MSMFKKLLVVGGVVGTVVVTAWLSPKVSRMQQVRDMYKENGLDHTRMEVDPGAFKMSHETTAQAVKDGTIDAIAQNLADYLMTGSPRSFMAAEQLIVRLRVAGKDFQAGTKPEATASEAAPATEAPVVADAATNDPAAPAAPAGDAAAA